MILVPQAGTLAIDYTDYADFLFDFFSFSVEICVNL